jgi:hypothetical protein
VPIIAISGAEDAVVASELLRLGADDYIDKKALTGKNLAQSIHQALARSDDLRERPQRFGIGRAPSPRPRSEPDGSPLPLSAASAEPVDASERSAQAAASFAELRDFLRAEESKAGGGSSHSGTHMRLLVEAARRVGRLGAAVRSPLARAAR